MEEGGLQWQERPREREGCSRCGSSGMERTTCPKLVFNRSQSFVDNSYFFQILTEKVALFSSFAQYFSTSSLKGVYKRGVFIAIKVRCHIVSSVCIERYFLAAVSLVEQCKLQHS